MIILDGKNISKIRKENLKNEVNELINIYNKKPTLAIIQINDNPASQIYVRNKQKAAAYCNMETKLIHLEETVSEEEVLQIIDELNEDSNINGIIAQLPLPKHINEHTIINHIYEEKDVDGFSISCKGKLFGNIETFTPATPTGIISLLEAYNIDISGKEAVIVGRSNIVGKPMAMLLLNKNATVTIAHSKTKDLKEVTKRADILVVAIGKAKYITEDMVKDGAVIVDVGINRIEDKIYGDVDFDNVANKVSYITPVPGGVGPLTIITLLENTVKAFKNQNK